MEKGSRIWIHFQLPKTPKIFQQSRTHKIQSINESLRRSYLGKVNHLLKKLILIL